MNLFYTALNDYKKYYQLQEIIQKFKINQLFVIIPHKDQNKYQKWNNVVKSLDVDILIVTYNDLLKIYKSNQNNYNQYIMMHTNNQSLVICNDFEFINSASSFKSIIIRQTIQLFNYNINYINEPHKGNQSSFILNALLLKNFYINKSDFINHHFNYFYPDKLDYNITLSQFINQLFVYHKSSNTFTINYHHILIQKFGSRLKEIDQYLKILF